MHSYLLTSSPWLLLFILMPRLSLSFPVRAPFKPFDISPIFSEHARMVWHSKIFRLTLKFCCPTLESEVSLMSPDSSGWRRVFGNQGLGIGCAHLLLECHCCRLSQWADEGKYLYVCVYVYIHTYTLCTPTPILLFCVSMCILKTCSHL